MSSAKDSAESHSEWRKVKEDIWNIHKKVKEISKEKACGQKNSPAMCGATIYLLTDPSVYMAHSRFNSFTIALLMKSLMVIPKLATTSATRA